VLAGFTVTEGATQTSGDSDPQHSGGGVWCESVSALVSNCVLTGNVAYYMGGGAFGGTLNNCTLTGNSSAYGGGTSQSTLDNCTLIGNLANRTVSGGGGAFGGIGGGAFGGALNNCTLADNSAALDGGGVAVSTLNNCRLTGNSASGSGGGASEATLNNCTLAGNSADQSGGADFGVLNNSIVYDNTAFYAGDNYNTLATLNYCCTTPLPVNGVGNITNPPVFLDQPGGNLRLQTNSPCINAGNNAYSPGPTDLGGNPRIAGGTVDIGAYEFPTPASVISYDWLYSYGLATDGSTDFADPDSDGMNNWQEWRAGTSPLHAASALRMLSAVVATNGLIVTWQSARGISYLLERSGNLAAPPGFSVLSTNLASQGDTTSYTDPDAPAPGPWFYRVGVRP